MNFEAIPAKEIDQYVDRDGYVVIDLRSEEEYAAGHIKNAENIPYYRIEDLNKCPSDQHMILYCERGGTSLLAAKLLSGFGCRVKTVIGGIQAYRGSCFVQGDQYR